MGKDYRNWHRKKILINTTNRLFFFHEREIWFCHLGANVGREQDGTGKDFLRPVIVVRKFNNEIFWAIPLTTTNKEIPESARNFYFSFSFIPEVKSLALLSQLCRMDARRLTRKIGVIEEIEFQALIKKLKALLP